MKFVSIDEVDEDIFYRSLYRVKTYLFDVIFSSIVFVIACASLSLYWWLHLSGLKDYSVDSVRDATIMFSLFILVSARFCFRSWIRYLKAKRVHKSLVVMRFD